MELKVECDNVIVRPSKFSVFVYPEDFRCDIVFFSAPPAEAKSEVSDFFKAKSWVFFFIVWPLSKCDEVIVLILLSFEYAAYCILSATLFAAMHAISAWSQSTVT